MYKSDSNEKVLSDVDNSTKPEIFGEWSLHLVIK